MILRFWFCFVFIINGCRNIGVGLPPHPASTLKRNATLYIYMPVLCMHMKFKLKKCTIMKTEYEEPITNIITRSTCDLVDGVSTQHRPSV